MRLAIPLLALLLLAGCSSTRITSTWRDPALGPVQLRRVAGLALSADPTLRRIAEDEFVRAVGAERGAVAGYSLVSDEDLRDRERVQARLTEAGVDGAVVFRLAAVDERQRWVPPTTYGTLGGYWGWAGPMVYEPGYMTTDRIAQVETAVYRVSDARLLWAARSDTLNPASASDLIDEVVRAAVEAMREQQLLP